MKRAYLGLFAMCLVGAAVAFSRQGQPAAEKPAAALAIKSEARNPWTHLRLNNDPEEFQFAIVSDRTGGHRPGVFSKAVEKLNLMQPEFVLSVGDLIEGGTKTPAQLEAEWKEFVGYVDRLKMPFFYVSGNHDVGNLISDQVWRERFGRRHYHFVYRGVLFLVLNTEGAGANNLGKEQIEYARKVLAENRDVRWTIVAMHKPVWVYAEQEKIGWIEVEKALADRPYTVFVGHVHRFQKFVRQGRNYYQLATTGGGSKLRGLPYGEFDEIVWVTMKKNGPVLAHVLLDAIVPEDLEPIKSTEPGVSTASRKPTYPLTGKLFFEGAPAPGAQVVFLQAGKVERPLRADALVEADGSFTLSTYKAQDGIPEGEYVVIATWRQPYYEPSGRPGPNRLPDRYARAETTPLKFTVKPRVVHEVTLELTK